MAQDERREYLIQYLLKEEVRFGRQNIPTDKQGQENLLRSLMNVRRGTRLHMPTLRTAMRYILFQKEKEH